VFYVHFLGRGVGPPQDPRIYSAKRTVKEGTKKKEYKENRQAKKQQELKKKREKILKR